MTQEEILEGKLIIGKFDGFILCDQYECDCGQYHKENSLIYYASEEFEYDKSWDWLMPVVEKIYLKDQKVDEFLITPGRTIITLKSGYIIRSPFLAENSMITECYIAVIEFIKWYNKNKK